MISVRPLFFYKENFMGQDLKGKELGKGLRQRNDGRYEGRYVDRFGKRKSIIGRSGTAKCRGKSMQ